MVQLKEEICVTPYLDRDINIRIKYKGVHIVLTTIEDKGVKYFMKINVGEQNEEYNKLYVTHIVN